MKQTVKFKEAGIGEIPEGWERMMLGDVAEPISRTHTFQGKREIIFINTGDILDGKFLHRDYSKISGLPGQAKKMIARDDILFTEIRPINKRFAYIDFDVTEDYVVSTKLMVIRAKKNIISKFLYRILIANDTLIEFQHIAESRSGTFPQITFDSIRNYSILVPSSFDEQYAIAKILSDLDEKIELNHQMNKTLESIAQTLFKRWFVDFKFPGYENKKFVNGLPEGWEIKNIYAAADVIYGAPFSSKLFNTAGVGKPLIRIRDLADETTEVFTPEIHPKGYLIKSGDIVVGMDGEFRAHLWGGQESWLNQRICVFTPIKSFSAPFVMNSIVPLLAEVESTETATTVIHLGKNDIDKFEILIPDTKILSLFNSA